MRMDAAGVEVSLISAWSGPEGASMSASPEAIPPPVSTV